MSAALEAVLQTVRRRFLAALPEIEESLVTQQVCLRDRKTKDLDLEEVRSNAHKMAGVSPTLGFAELGAKAAMLDRLIGSELEQGKSNRQEILLKLEALLSEISHVRQAETASAEACSKSGA